MKLGYIGLGKMGKNMVLRLHEQGISLVAWNRSPEPREEVRAAGVEVADTLEELISKLRENPDSSLRELGLRPEAISKQGISSSPAVPRNDSIVIWLMLPAGEVVDEFIEMLIPYLKEGDLLIDGGNSFYKDSIRRSEKLSKLGIHYMDIGTSGGPGGARSGACIMVGGRLEDYQKVKFILKAAAAPNSYQHLGKVGAGHFAKMVHNGVEYGMMEAIGEGFALLKYSEFNFDLAKVADLYNHRSVVESRLVDWTKQALEEDPELTETSSMISHTGEGEWTIKVAQELKVDVPVILSSFEVRVNSPSDPEDSPEGYRNKVVSAMRGKFGHHIVKKI